MRRYWVLVLAVLTLLGALAPPAVAQAPAPKVTITGLLDNLANFNRNQGLNATDRTRGSLVDPSDDEFYARTRGIITTTGALGKAKAVLALELDLIYGQTGAADVCNGFITGANVGCRPDGTSGGLDADNDVRIPIELKHMFVEFPFSGPDSLLPFVPFAGMARVGGQAYTITYKPFIFAASDFGGGHVDMTFTPTLKGSLTFVQFEEDLVGRQGALAGTNFSRGDDWGIIVTAESFPTKELKVKPIYAYQLIDGTTSALVRRGTGGFGVAAANFAPDSTNAAVGTVTTLATLTTCVATPNCKGTEENRHTIGFDARWTMGPWYVDPTFFYQFGNRQRFEGATDPGSAGAGNLRVREADISAWIFDVAAGYRVGPLLLEVRGLYTSGNKASDNLNKEISYYQPFQTGNAYWIGWGEASTIGAIDYLTALNGFSNSLSHPGNVGYDRFGRAQFAVKATYSVTPALSVYGIVSPQWTARQVDTDQVITANGYAFPTAAGVTRPGSRREEGDESHLGTDLTAGFTWRFAPGLTFDWVYGVLIPGGASDVTVDTGTHAGGAASGVFRKFDAENSYVTTARVRYTF